MKLANRSRTVGKIEHSVRFTLNSEKRFICRLAAEAAVAGPASRFSTNCVTLVVVSYTSGNTKEGASHVTPTRVICNWIWKKKKSENENNNNIDT